ncbi:MAG: Ig-like domain-containing protein [Acidobacteriota bacterium]|nr:Ig-like domain-containing protein [Acidobacteriota bacterium]
MAGASVVAMLVAVIVAAQAGTFQEKYEGELYGVRRESQLPGFLGGVAYANGTLYAAQADLGNLIAYADDSSPGCTVTLLNSEGLVPNQLAVVDLEVVDVDEVTGTTTVTKQALLVSDSSVNRVMAFDIPACDTLGTPVDAGHLFTMLLDWPENPTPPELTEGQIAVINGMSMAPGSKFRLTTDDTADPTLSVVGTFAAAWAVGFGQQYPGALLAYRNQDFEFDSSTGYFTESAPFRQLTNNGRTREAFGVAFDAGTPVSGSRLFLVDTFEFNITAYGPDLEPTSLFTFGDSAGGETERFTEPFGIAFQPDGGDPAGGRLFVADALNNRVVAYRLRADESTLDPLFSIALPESESGGLKGQPYGVAVEPSSGKLAVSDDASNEDGTVTLYRAWVLQTRNLVAYNLEVLDASGVVVPGVCAGDPYQLRFSLTVPATRPPVEGATPSLTVGGQVITGPNTGPVDLEELETYAYTYSLTAPTTPGNVSVLATATAPQTTDVQPIQTVVEIADCSAPPPVITATPSDEPQVSGVTTMLQVGPNDYQFDVYLDAAVSEGDAGGIQQIEYEIVGTNETGNDLLAVLNTGDPLPPTQRAVVTLRQPGVTTIYYRTQSEAGVWSARDEALPKRWTGRITIELVGFANRQNTEGDVLVPFFLPGQPGFTYTVTDLPDGAMVDPTDPTGRKIIGTLSFESEGSHQVRVTESDSTSSSSWTFTWRVNNFNRPPTAMPDAFTISEDTKLTVAALGGVLANDADADGDTLTATMDWAPSHGTLLLNADGSFDYTPHADFNGTDTFTYWANDGSVSGLQATVTITVTAVNDPPSFTLGAPPTVIEDAPLQTLAGWATGISPGPADESGQTVTFLVSNDNPALFAVAPAITANGTLTYQPAANTSGTALVTVRAQDDGGGTTNTSTAKTFTITVDGVNDAPSFTKGPDQTVAEDAAAQNVANWATAISAGAGETQTVSFVVSNDNSTLFTAGGQPQVSATGTLSYTPSPNANGSATVTVSAQDNGGTANGGVDTSTPQTFTITVTPVNDPPSFTRGNAPTVLEDSGAQTFVGWATAITAGPVDESAQVVAFTVTNTNTALFVAQPALAADGTLTFQPAPDAFGTASVTVLLADDGGTLNGGSNTSAPQTFTITVTGVNDVPSFTGGAAQTVDEDSGAQSMSWATAISPGPGESSQTVTFQLVNPNPSLFSVQPAISASGTLTYTPAANAFGTATITVLLKDNGGVADGGVDTSEPQTLTITVTAVNDAPVAVNDAFSIGQDGTLTVAAPGVLAGDSDVDHATLTASLLTGPNHGTLLLNPDGSFVYTPDPGYYGSDSFTYRAHDTLISSNSATVTITVVPSNLPPVCSATVSPALLQWPPNHRKVYVTLSGITDPDGQPLTIRFTSIWQDEPTDGLGQGNTMQDGGIESNGATAWVRAERSGLGDGRVYLIDYTASDGALSCSGQVSVGVPHDQRGTPPVLSPGRWNSLDGQPVLPPPAPVAANDAATVATRQSVTIAVLSNDVANGSPLTVTLVSKPAKGTGTATVNADGTITYKASKSTGTMSFTYRITDIYGGTATATVTITVTG